MPDVKFRVLVDGVPAEWVPAAALATALPQIPVVVEGVTRSLSETLASKAALGHTLVANQDYTCIASDVQIGIAPLTAPRTIYLPDVDTYPLGQDLVIADESGVCSETLTITIRPGPGTGDVLGVPDGILQLADPYQSARFRRGATNLWIRL